MAADHVYITTPIYYVNGDPHIGHAHTSIVADALKRVHQMRGADVLLTTGTDEHGQKNQEAAVASGLARAQDYLDRQSGRFRSLFEKLDVQFDRWVRTTDQHHKDVVSEVLRRLHAKGLIEKRQYRGLYCVGCELFKKKSDLDENGNCPDHQVAPVEMDETNYFLFISRLQSWLVRELKERTDWIQPDTYRRETLAMLEEPLEDLCISRPKRRVWLGVELPFDSEYVTYVWFDALLNYLSNIGWPREEYRAWWPSATHLMAKDIIKTHCIYWPIILQMLEVDPPKAYRIHGFWVGEGGNKMSKSVGNVVSPEALLSVVGTDGLRFYLVKTMRGVDAQISESLVTLTYNSDLANNIGNLHSRTLKLAQRHFGAQILRPELESGERELLAWVTKSAQDALTAADLKSLPDLAQTAISIGARLNGYFDQSKPWELAKQGQVEKLQCSLWTCLNGLRVLLELLWPIMPNATTRALSNLSGRPHDPVGTVHQFVAEPSAGALLLETGPDNLFPRAGVAKR